MGAHSTSNRNIDVLRAIAVLSCPDTYCSLLFLVVPCVVHLYSVIEYSNEADMLSALKKLDDTKLDGNYVRLYESTGAGPVRDSRPDNRSGGRGYGRSRSRSPRGRSPAPRGRSRSRSPIGGRGRSRSRSLPKRDRSPARSKSPRGRSPSPRARSRSPAAARARSPSPRRD